MSRFSPERLESIAGAVLRPVGANGLHARTGLFEQVLDGVAVALDRERDAAAEVLRFPPVMSRALLEQSGYHKNFPHLLGCVCSMHGSEAEIRTLLATDKPWVDALDPTELVLTPAACYPVYPMAAARGPVPAAGLIFDVASYCFRREATHEPGRMQSFRMREFVHMGTPESAQSFRHDWVPRAERLAQRLALPYRIDRASDPFFGRVGKMMAVSQVEQALKFELLIPVNSEEAPTACMSFNYHQDHFGTTWGLSGERGDVAHTACVAFGLDRLGLALFATHGLDLKAWPATVRETLSL
jgi:seryl-tRNA synthetase